MSKLQQLAKLEGVSVEDMLRDAVFDGVSPGICKNKDCDYTTEVEPDQNRGWCEDCQENSVASACVLAEII